MTGEEIVRGGAAPGRLKGWGRAARAGAPHARGSAGAGGRKSPPHPPPAPPTQRGERRALRRARLRRRAGELLQAGAMVSCLACAAKRRNGGSPSAVGTEPERYARAPPEDGHGGARSHAPGPQQQQHAADLDGWSQRSTAARRKQRPRQRRYGGDGGLPALTREVRAALASRGVAGVRALVAGSGAGVAPAARALAWPYLLGVYEPHPHGAGHDAEHERAVAEHAAAVLDARLRAAAAALRAREPRACESLRQLAVDAPRTDPHLALLASGGAGRAALNRVLLAHCTHEESVGFYQGMGDLLSPFLLVFMETSKADAGGGRGAPPASAAMAALAGPLPAGLEELERGGGGGVDLEDVARAAEAPCTRAEALAHACFEALMRGQAGVFEECYAHIDAHARAVDALVRANDTELAAALDAAQVDMRTLALRPLLVMLRRCVGAARDESAASNAHERGGQLVHSSEAY